MKKIQEQDNSSYSELYSEEERELAQIISNSLIEKGSISSAVKDEIIKKGLSLGLGENRINQIIEEIYPNTSDEEKELLKKAEELYFNEKKIKIRDCIRVIDL